MKVTEEIRNFKAESISAGGVEELKEASREARVWAVVATAAAKSGHPAGALSSMDIYMTLLGAANVTPALADSPERDRIVVSHGHTSAGFYAALAAYGFFPVHEMAANFRRAGSPYQGHVERDVPGVDWGTGNLGQGLAAGVGFALAARARGSQAHSWVVMGDGEQVKGQVAEARRLAAKEKLTNLTVLVDWNDIQISGRLEEVMPVNIPALWAADGWQVVECDGHDYNALYRAMKAAKEASVPTVILCRTTMGKGVSFMENIPDYHGKPAAGEKLEQALKELGSDISLFNAVLEERKGPLPKGRHVAPEKPALALGVPHTYTKEDKKDNRGAFGKALAEVGELNYKKADATPMLVFDCDLAGSVKVDGFAKLCPDNYVEAGIQEHMTATAAGAATAPGVGSGRGAFSGIAGVVVPADPNQTDRATRWMLTEPGNICLAMGRSVLPVVTKEDGSPFYGGDYEFRDGAIDLLREGTDAVILAMGHLAGRAVEAHEALAKEGISAKVLHCATPLTMDNEALFALVGELPLLTCEDHHADTGIGAVAAMAFARAGKAVRIKNLGVTRYGLSGSNSDVLADMGLTAAGIAAGVRELLK